MPVWSWGNLELAEGNVALTKDSFPFTLEVRVGRDSLRESRLTLCFCHKLPAGMK